MQSNSTSPFPVLQFHSQMVIIDFSAFELANYPSDFRPHSLQQRQRSFQACCRIMVAGNNDNLQIRILRCHPINKLIIHALGCSGRVGNIKNISGYNQCINLFLTNFFCQPIQEYLMFSRAIISKKGLSQMPVGSM